jgi:poly(rC)-binding protein 2/3/4
MEEVERNGHSTFGKPGYSTRVLVPKSQFYWLVGLGGAVIQEIVKSTGAGIEIMDEADVPACASHCERVLQASIFLERKGIITVLFLYFLVLVSVLMIVC